MTSTSHEHDVCQEALDRARVRQFRANHERLQHGLRAALEAAERHFGDVLPDDDPLLMEIRSVLAKGRASDERHG